MQRELGGVKVWQWGLVVVVLAVIVAGVFRPEDEPDPPTRGEVAQQTWDGMGLTDRAAMCDGYRMGGESFVVANLLDGTDDDERMAEALLDVIRNECD